jgi:hypothetical protein
MGKLGAVLVASVVVACVAVAGAAFAGTGNEPMALKGKQIPVNEAAGEYKLTGGLLGAFYVESFVPSYKGADGKLVASGKESFRGCNDVDGNGTCDTGEPSGTLRFTYVYWASFTKAGSLVRGECMHPISGGTGGFANATGFLHMWDTPQGKKVVTTYTGSIQYPSPPSTSSRTPSRTLAAFSAGGCRPS